MRRMHLSESLIAMMALACGVAVSTSAQAAPAASAAPAEKARVFVTDSESWEMSGHGGGGGGVFASEQHGGARPQTAEIVKTFGQRCSEVVVNNRQDVADYIVVLDHEGGKGALRHKNKVAVFERNSGDVIVSHSTLSLGGSVEDACNGIVQHWGAHSAELLAAKAKAGAPAATAAAVPAALPVAAPQQAAQASLAVDSNPAGADIEIDGGFVGNTPSTLMLAPGSHEVVIRKKGYGAWTWKLNVTGGTVHLNAELEAQAAQ